VHLPKVDLSASGETIRSTWEVLRPLPGGTRLFSWLIGLANPYTGTVHPRFLEVRPGFARAQICDRRAIRNHVRSVHAIALANVAEVITGLAVMTGLPSDARAILVGLSVEYVKKARGRLTAECTCDPPSTSEAREVIVQSCVTDEKGDVVARAQARWKVGPRVA
jgi:acyl-coenzyme A thioesterase PaaI-like protein